MTRVTIEMPRKSGSKSGLVLGSFSLYVQMSRLTLPGLSLLEEWRRRVGKLLKTGPGGAEKMRILLLRHPIKACLFVCFWL